MDRLREILETKRAEIARLEPLRASLRDAAHTRVDPPRFRRALDRGPGSIGIIAEVKRASPSAGLIADEFDPVAIARAYQAGGAHAISVLTDEPFFRGHLDHLRAARAAVDLPLLRKDFVLDEIQIHEAAANGADAILLIVAALDPQTLRHLLDTARACNLDALVETHTREELGRAIDAGADLVGINNRDLKSFKVDLDTSRSLAPSVPDEVLLVSESGIRTPDDAADLHRHGVDAILVGESLMRSPDPGAAIRAMLDAAREAPGPGSDTKKLSRRRRYEQS